MRAMTIATIWPNTVAAAAPWIPSFGKPASPKIRTGSRKMLMMAPVPWVIMLKKVRPVDCRMRSNIISPKIPKLNTQQICRYWVPMRMISGLSVWLLKKISAPKIPNTAKAAKPSTARNTPLTAARSAFS